MGGETQRTSSSARLTSLMFSLFVFSGSIEYTEAVEATESLRSSPSSGRAAGVRLETSDIWRSG